MRLIPITTISALTRKQARFTTLKPTRNTSRTLFLLRFHQQREELQLNNKAELLSPAGDYECLEAAVDYGCDAVYLGGTSFGMRATPKNFDMEGLQKAVSYAHERGAKVYLTC